MDQSGAGGLVAGENNWAALAAMENRLGNLLGNPMAV